MASIPSPLQFEFREKSLRGKVVLLAGGSGGLGAATASLLAREGARLLIGYRSNVARARQLQQRLREDGAEAELVEGDLNQAGVVEEYIRRAATLGPVSAAAIFMGDPARGSTSGPSTAEA
ncbi:MAG: SDR family NAD(P)-dependent oxidoreductase, partial [Acidobacteria bacterium]|nr:SDR family NAD(P)-dependent oxidoreductase [Acidobacteriota bacterium]